MCTWHLQAYDRQGGLPPGLHSWQILPLLLSSHSAGQGRQALSMYSVHDAMMVCNKVIYSVRMRKIALALFLLYAEVH